MYIKGIGILLVAGCSAAIGLSFAGELTERVCRLVELKRILLYFRGELQCYHGSLEEIFLHLQEHTTGNFQCFFRSLSEDLQKKDGIPFWDLWKQHIEEPECFGRWWEEDQEILKKLGEGLGYLDLQMQQESIGHALACLEENLETARALQKEKGRLYRMLGGLAGIFLIILLI